MNNQRRVMILSLALAAVAFIISQTPLLAQSANGAKFQQYQKDAIKAVQLKDFQKALQHFEAAQKQHNSWETLQNIAACQMELGHYGKAIASLQQSIEIGGLHGSQCTNLAAIYQRQGDTSKALAWLKLSCAVEPANASNPAIQAAIQELQNPETNPAGSPKAPEYLSDMRAIHRWRKEDMPLKVFVRKNIQLPDFHQSYVDVVGETLRLWCSAADGAISYRIVDSSDGANIVCDYTDHRELVSSKHELGIDGVTESMHKADNSMGFANVVLLVKDSPSSKAFRNRSSVLQSCVHEFGHALGMSGHSSNPNDAMYPAAVVRESPLTQRDRNTIRRIYNKKAPK